MRVLLTGASGLLGSRVALLLTKTGHEVLYEYNAQQHDDSSLNVTRATSILNSKPLKLDQSLQQFRMCLRK